MPFLVIQTNVKVEPKKGAKLLRDASRHVAESLGKSEKYVMVALEDDTPMLFGGKTEPLAYLELKSIGLPKDKTPLLSATLSSLLQDEIGVTADRVYIEFADALAPMWGWNGSTL